MNSALISSLRLQSFTRDYPTARILAIRWNGVAKCLNTRVSDIRHFFYDAFLWFIPSIVFFENVLPFVRASPLCQSSNDAYISCTFIATFLRDLLQQFHANFAWKRGEC